MPIQFMADVHVKRFRWNAVGCNFPLFRFTSRKFIINVQRQTFCCSLFQPSNYIFISAQTSPRGAQVFGIKYWNVARSHHTLKAVPTKTLFTLKQHEQHLHQILVKGNFEVSSLTIFHKHSVIIFIADVGNSATKT